MKKIAIVGTVGIPANYGGFETLSENLTKYLGNKLEFTVYCSSKRFNEKMETYNGSKLKYINLDANGMQSIPYDIISLFHAAKCNKTILILGVSGCIILPVFRIFYPSTKLIINIDGLEYRRPKWKKYAQVFLKFSEKIAVKYGNIIISDNKAIKEHVTSDYQRESLLIAYGGDHANHKLIAVNVINKYALPNEYAFKVSRIEPENNIHLILEAFEDSLLPLVIVGNWNNSEYGNKLKDKYDSYSNIILLDSIYNQDILDQIRSNCKIYIHGHSTGGSNPSLVEAMSLGLPVFAFDVIYNRETTFFKARYFRTPNDLKKLINQTNSLELNELSNDMLEIAQHEYTWKNISKKYFNILSA
jgi:glycosyltransferase involved in cell wall biosynthesis